MGISRRIRPYAWLVLLLSIGTLLYSTAGLVMVASLAEAPSASMEVMRQRAFAWQSGVVVSILLCALSVFILVKSRKNR